MGTLENKTEEPRNCFYCPETLEQLYQRDFLKLPNLKKSGICEQKAYLYNIFLQKSSSENFLRESK